MKAMISTGQEETTALNAGQQEMHTTFSAGEEEVKAGQEGVKAMISTIQSSQTEFEETISKWMECILVSVDQQTQASLRNSAFAHRT
jgi:hypothetical protein